MFIAAKLSGVIGMKINPEISIGHILTSVSVLISALGLLVSWQRMASQRRRTEADKIRSCVGVVIAKLARWKDVSLHIFDVIQTVITEADMLLVATQNIVEVRDYFWKELGQEHAKVMQQIMKEQIEIAYADLEGYDPNIQALFSRAVGQMKETDRYMHLIMLDDTQKGILSLQSCSEEFFSSQLGNVLRNMCAEAFDCQRKILESIVLGFRTEMNKIIQAKNEEIIGRTVEIRSGEQVLPDISKALPSREQDTTLTLSRKSVKLESLQRSHMLCHMSRYVHLTLGSLRHPGSDEIQRILDEGIKRPVLESRGRTGKKRKDGGTHVSRKHKNDTVPHVSSQKSQKHNKRRSKPLPRSGP